MAVQNVAVNVIATGSPASSQARQRPSPAAVGGENTSAPDTLQISKEAKAAANNQAGPPGGHRRVERSAPAVENQLTAQPPAPTPTQLVQNAQQGMKEARRTEAGPQATNANPSAPEASRTGAAQAQPVRAPSPENREGLETRAVKQVLNAQAERSYAAASLQGRINRNQLDRTV